MSRDRYSFTTHRCGSMPKGFSIRMYVDCGNSYQYPEPGGWVLGRREWDMEWDVEYLEHVTPLRKSHIRFCPWCGKRLEVDE